MRIRLSKKGKRLLYPIAVFLLMINMYASAPVNVMASEVVFEKVVPTALPAAEFQPVEVTQEQWEQLQSVGQDLDSIQESFSFLSVIPNTDAGSQLPLTAAAGVLGLAATAAYATRRSNQSAEDSMEAALKEIERQVGEKKAVWDEYNAKMTAANEAENEYDRQYKTLENDYKRAYRNYNDDLGRFGDRWLNERYNKVRYEESRLASVERIIRDYAPVVERLQKEINDYEEAKKADYDRLDRMTKESYDLEVQAQELLRRLRSHDYGEYGSYKKLYNAFDSFMGRIRSIDRSASRLNKQLNSGIHSTKKQFNHYSGELGEAKRNVSYYSSRATQAREGYESFKHNYEVWKKERPNYLKQAEELQQEMNAVAQLRNEKENEFKELKDQFNNQWAAYQDYSYTDSALTNFKSAYATFKDAYTQVMLGAGVISKEVSEQYENAKRAVITARNRLAQMMKRTPIIDEDAAEAMQSYTAQERTFSDRIEELASSEEDKALASAYKKIASNEVGAVYKKNKASLLAALNAFNTESFEREAFPKEREYAPLKKEYDKYNAQYSEYRSQWNEVNMDYLRKEHKWNYYTTRAERNLRDSYSTVMNYKGKYDNYASKVSAYSKTIEEMDKRIAEYKSKEENIKAMQHYEEVQREYDAMNARLEVLGKENEALYYRMRRDPSKYQELDKIRQKNFVEMRKLWDTTRSWRKSRGYLTRARAAVNTLYDMEAKRSKAVHYVKKYAPTAEQYKERYESWLVGYNKAKAEYDDFKQNYYQKWTEYQAAKVKFEQLSHDRNEADNKRREYDNKIQAIAQEYNKEQAWKRDYYNEWKEKLAGWKAALVSGEEVDIASLQKEIAEKSEFFTTRTKYLTSPSSAEEITGQLSAIVNNALYAQTKLPSVVAEEKRRLVEYERSKKAMIASLNSFDAVQTKQELFAATIQYKACEEKYMEYSVKESEAKSLYYKTSKEIEHIQKEEARHTGGEWARTVERQTRAMNSAYDEMKDYEEEIVNSEKNLPKLQSQLDEFRKKNATKIANLKKMEDRIPDLKEKIEEAKKARDKAYEALKNASGLSKGEYNHLRSAYKSAEDRVRSAQGNCDNYYRRIEREGRFMKKANELSSAMGRIKRELPKLKEKYENAQKNYIGYKGGYENIMNKHEAFVADTQNRKAHLEELNNQRSTASSNMQKYDKLAQEHYQKVLDLRDIKAKQEPQIKQYEAWVAKVAEWKKALTSGEAVDLVSLQKEINDESDFIQSLQDSTSKNTLVSFTESIKSVGISEAAITTYIASSKNTSSSSSSSTFHNSYTETPQTVVENDYSGVFASNEGVEVSVQKSAVFLSLSKDLTAKEQRIESYRNKLQSNEQTITFNNTTVRENSKKEIEYTRTLKSLESEYNSKYSSSSAVKSLANSRDNAKNQMEGYERTMNVYKAKMSRSSRYRRYYERYKEKYESAKREYESYKAQVDQFMSKRSSLSGQIKDYEAKIAGLNTDNAKYTRDIQEKEFENKALQAQLDEDYREREQLKVKLAEEQVRMEEEAKKAAVVRHPEPVEGQEQVEVLHGSAIVDTKFTVTSLEEIKKLQNSMPEWAQGLWKGDSYIFDTDEMIQRYKGNIERADLPEFNTNTSLRSLIQVVSQLSFPLAIKLAKKMYVKGELGDKYLDHFLEGSGEPLIVDIKSVLSNDSRVRKSLYASIQDKIENGITSGEFKIKQGLQGNDVADEEFWSNQDYRSAFGTVDLSWKMENNEVVIYWHDEYSFNINNDRAPRDSYPLYKELGKKVIDGSASDFVMTGLLNLSLDEISGNQSIQEESFHGSANNEEITLTDEEAKALYLQYLKDYESGKVKEGVVQSNADFEAGFLVSGGFILKGLKEATGLWSIVKSGTKWLLKNTIGKSTAITKTDDIQNAIMKKDLRGAKINDRVLIPKDWIREPAKGDGWIYYNPKNSHEFFRVMKRGGNSNFLNYDKPYYRIQKNGNYFDEAGNIVPNKSSNSHVIIKKIQL